MANLNDLMPNGIKLHEVTAGHAKQFLEVSLATLNKVIDICDPTWRIIIALSRFGGLRTPSETLSLKWTDIDWDKSTNRARAKAPFARRLQVAWELAKHRAEVVLIGYRCGRR